MTETIETANVDEKKSPLWKRLVKPLGIAAGAVLGAAALAVVVANRSSQNEDN